MRLINYTFISILSFFITYLIFSYSLADFNPFNWEEEDRIFSMFISVVSSIVFCALNYHLEE